MKSGVRTLIVFAVAGVVLLWPKPSQAEWRVDWNNKHYDVKLRLDSNSGHHRHSAHHGHGWRPQRHHKHYHGPRHIVFRAQPVWVPARWTRWGYQSGYWAYPAHY